MTQIEPKRCPMCGSKNIEVIFDTKTKERTIMAANPYSSLKVTLRYNVTCISCGLMLDNTYLTRMKAVDVWNKTDKLAIPKLDKHINKRSSGRLTGYFKETKSGDDIEP